MEKKSDADMAELTAVKAALMDALQKVAALEAKQTAAAAAGGAAVTEDQVPDEVADSIANKRIELRARARRVLGETDTDGKPLKLDGLSAKEIRRRVVAKAMPTTKLDGLSDETLTGMFLAVTNEGAQAARNDALAEAHRAAHPITERTDGDDDGDLDPRDALARRTGRNFERRASGESEVSR